MLDPSEPANPDDTVVSPNSQQGWLSCPPALATGRGHTARGREHCLLDYVEETVPIMPRSMQCAFAGFVLSTLGLGACVQHDPEPAFRASVLIDDRGISIPLPPPSLVDEPEQDVDVEGEVIGRVLGPGLLVRVVDHAGGAELDMPLIEGSNAFHGEGLAIDLSDNCLELWLVDEEGREGARAQYQAIIDASDESIEVVEGCD
jgi:hypothetical protein